MHCPFLRRQRPRRMGNKIKVVKLPFEIVFTHHLLYWGSFIFVFFYHMTRCEPSNSQMSPMFGRPESMQWTKLIARFPGEICTTHGRNWSLEANAKWNWAWATFPYSSWSLWVGESSLWLLKLKKCEINVPNFRCLENKQKIMQLLRISCSNEKKKRKYYYIYMNINTIIL